MTFRQRETSSGHAKLENNAAGGIIFEFRVT